MLLTASKSVPPEQLPESVATPVHGVVPPLNPLVLLLVATLSQAPEQAPHGPHTSQEPSTKMSNSTLAKKDLLRNN